MAALTEREKLVLHKAQKYFTTHPDDFQNFAELLNEGEISIRILDWAVSNYAKFHSTMYVLNGSAIFPFIEYKRQLDGGSTKSLFDCFRRGRTFEWSPDPAAISPIQTSIGQLAWFAWAYEIKLIDYVRENYDSIKADCDTRNTQAERGPIQPGKTRRKRRELSVSALQWMSKRDVNVILTFD